MAAKNTRKGSTKADKPFKVVLPEGFKAINPQGTAWKPENIGDALRGIMTKVRTVNVERKRGKEKVMEECHIYTIENDDGAFDVWSSAGLRGLADVEEGQEVYIVYTGPVEVGQAQPMRGYQVAVFDSPTRAGSGKKTKKG